MMSVKQTWGRGEYSELEAAVVCVLRKKTVATWFVETKPSKNDRLVLKSLFVTQGHISLLLLIFFFFFLERLHVCKLWHYALKNSVDCQSANTHFKIVKDKT